MPSSAFIAYMRNDADVIEKIIRCLEDASITVFIDTLTIESGDNWFERIREHINNCSCFLPCFSTTACTTAKSEFNLEIRLALHQAALRHPSLKYIIPVRLDDCEIPDYSFNEAGLRLRHFQYIDYFSAPEEACNRIREAVTSCRAPHRGSSESNKKRESTPTIQRLNSSIWDELEKIARTIATNAGFAAMTYYRNALYHSDQLDSGSNPSTMADKQAMISAIQSMHLLRPLHSKLGYSNIAIFGEELSKDTICAELKKLFNGTTIYDAIKCSSNDFREDWENSIAVLVDPIDGTVSFDTGVPFFCSSAAIFLGGRLSVSAIYDPFHHEVYFGSLRILEDGMTNNHARKWSVATGTTTLLTNESPSSKSPLLATHLTRSDPPARDKMLQFLMQLYNQTEFSEGRGTYMLNSGEMALAYVAQGNIDSFINNTTGIWDVAAGEVLVRAAGGKVSDFFGNTLDYKQPDRISVLAARNSSMHEKLKSIISTRYPFVDKTDKMTYSA